MDSHWFVTFAAAILLSGCLLEVYVPEGGRVVTLSGSLDCGPGETCQVEVPDTNFDETFRALPDSEMVLDGWRRGRGYFNPGNKDSFRAVTEAFGSFPSLLSVLESDQVFFLEPIFVNDPYPEIAAHRVALDQMGILDNLGAVLEYARDQGLSTFNVDAIIRADPGTTQEFARANNLWEGNGYYRIEDFALKFTKSILVPTNPADVAYPDDYEEQRFETVTVEDPFCDLTPERIVIPQDYMGSYPLPAIEVTSPRQPFRKIGHLKDAWKIGNASFIRTCYADTHEAIAVTLQRMQQANIDTIVVYPWTSIDYTVEPWRVLNPEETRSSTIYDEDLEYIVNTAKSLGMTVFWRNQIQQFQEGSTGKYLPTLEDNEENVRKSYDAMETYLAERGQFLEKLGVDGVSLTPWFWAGFGTVLSAPEFRAATRAHINALKSTFSGTIMHDLDTVLAKDSGVSALVDLWEHSIYYNEVAPVSGALTVDKAVPRLVSQLDYIRRLVADGKLVVRPFASSRGNLLANKPYLEETFCTVDYGDISVSPGKCVQAEAPTDLSLQAILYQAAFEAAFGIDGFNPSGVSVDYWMTDGIVASTTFPNLSYSVRNKPAEQVVMQWFGAN